MAKKCPKCQSDNPGTATFCAECGTQLPSIKDIEVTETMETPKEELTTGSTFAGRYQIIEELGRGGMGKVYKVLDKEVNAKVALKLIKPEIASDKKTIERFRNELKVARDIAHKNVCRMYDLGKEEGAYYITMEYVSGEDLKSFIRRAGFLSAGKAISIASQVCEGLDEAHRLGVVHRDLKPQNIMIDKEGNARIMDFGIARSLRTKGITGSGVMIGTPEYMSPEQVDGKEADQRADIYSLGVILYEMVTGRVPFEGDTPFSIGVKQKSEVPQPPKEINQQIPDDLNRLILRCMEKEKESRYQSVDELQSELMGLEKGIPTTERIVPERKPLTSREITVQFNLKKMFIPALAVIAVVIVALVLWQIISRKKPAPLAPEGKPSLAVVYFDNNTGDKNLDHWRKAIADLLITDLSQSRYLKVLGRDKLYDILKQTSLLDAKSYSSTDIKEIAARGGVNHILQGSYVKAGETYRLNYTLQNIDTGEQLGSDMLEAIGADNILSMVDDLTKKIKEDFRFTKEEIASDLDMNIGTITTSSPEAYKFYMEAARLHLDGNFKSAIPVYQKAIALDPEFATAYRSMGIAYGNLGFFDENRKYLKKAYELSERVSDRERYRNEAEFYGLNEQTFDRAIEAYNKLLELYPDDGNGNTNLANLYLQIEEWDKAIERLEYLHESMLDYSSLADAYTRKGMFDKAKDTLEEYLDNYPDNFFIHHDLSQVYRDKGEYELALSEIEKAFSLNPTHFRNHWYKGDIYLCMVDMAKAEQEYQNLFQNDDPLYKAIGSMLLGNLYFLLGKFGESKKYFEQFLLWAKSAGQHFWEQYAHINNLGQLYLRSRNTEKALEEFNKGLEIAVEQNEWLGQRLALYNRGLAYLEQNSLDDAHKVAEELKELCQQSINKRLIRMHHALIGLIELEKKNFVTAIESINKAISLDPHVFKDHVNLLAWAYYESGDLDSARTEYERIITCPRGMLKYGFDCVNSFYMLGKIYEQQDNTAKAIENYEKFLDLWKDADPGIAEVEDANKRLAGLR